MIEIIRCNFKLGTEEENFQILKDHIFKRTDVIHSPKRNRKIVIFNVIKIQNLLLDFNQYCRCIFHVNCTNQQLVVEKLINDIKKLTQQSIKTFDIMCQCHQPGSGFVKSRCNCVLQRLGKHFENSCRPNKLMSAMQRNLKDKFTIILRLPPNDNTDKLIQRMKEMCKWPSNLIFIIILTTNDRIEQSKINHCLQHTHSKETIIWYNLND